MDRVSEERLEELIEYLETGPDHQWRDFKVALRELQRLRAERLSANSLAGREGELTSRMQCEVCLGDTPHIKAHCAACNGTGFTERP